jgi:hypothetical protein
MVVGEQEEESQLQLQPQLPDRRGGFEDPDDADDEGDRDQHEDFHASRPSDSIGVDEARPAEEFNPVEADPIGATRGDAPGITEDCAGRDDVARVDENRDRGTIAMRAEEGPGRDGDEKEDNKMIPPVKASRPEPAAARVEARARLISSERLQAIERREISCPTCRSALLAAEVDDQELSVLMAAATWDRSPRHAEMVVCADHLCGALYRLLDDRVLDLAKGCVAVNPPSDWAPARVRALGLEEARRVLGVDPGMLTSCTPARHSAPAEAV